MSLNLTFWDAKYTALRNSFVYAESLERLWTRLQKDKVALDNGSEDGVQGPQTHVTDEVIRWADLDPDELQDLLLRDHLYFFQLQGRTVFEERGALRLRLLRRFYQDLAQFAVEVYSKTGASTHPGAKPSACISQRTSAPGSPNRTRRSSPTPGTSSGDTLMVPQSTETEVSEGGQARLPASRDTILRRRGTAEDRFLHFAIRSLVNVLFAFLREANRNSDSSVCRHLLEDAKDLLADLPLASLQKIYDDNNQENWIYTIRRAQLFLEELCEPSASPDKADRISAFMLRLELAAQTGNGVSMLGAITHLLHNGSDRELFLPAHDYLQRFSELRQQHTTALDSSSQSSTMPDVVSVVDVLENQLRKDEPFARSVDPLRLAALLLTQLARLSPPDRAEFEDVKVFSWGNTRDAELGYVANQPVESPQINTLLSRLNPTHIALGQRGTFVIDGEGRLWSCGSHTRPQNDVKSFLGHAESSLALVEGLESERFIQVSATSHVLAVTLQGEVYSWGSNSYKQLGRDGVNNRPMKITALEGEEVVQVCAGGHHSAAVSKAGNLYTWGRGGYGRLGHGTSDDVNVPTRVAAFPEGIRVVHVACGLGDAHSMCVTEDGHIYSFGDGDFGKLGHGTNDRRRQPERIDFEFDGSGVKAAWCGLQISGCLTNHGALYTWGSCALGALGNGRVTGSVPSPTRILEDHVITNAAMDYSCGLAVTAENEVYQFGTVSEGTKTNPTPVLLTTLVGKNVTQVAVGSNHAMAWTGSLAVLPLTPVPFAPAGDQASLLAIARTLEALMESCASPELRNRCVYAILSMLERSLQLAVRTRAAIGEEVVAPLRNMLLTFASASLSVSSQVATSAQFCLLQGWPILNVAESDRQRLLKAVTDVVFAKTEPAPSPEDIHLARELIRSRWRFLMPVSDRLHNLSELLPQTSNILARVHRSDVSDTDRIHADGHDFFVTVIIDSLIQDGVVESCVLELFGFDVELVDDEDRGSHSSDTSFVAATRAFEVAFGLEFEQVERQPVLEQIVPPVCASVLSLIREAVTQWTDICRSGIQSKRDVLVCNSLTRLVLQFQRVLFALVTNNSACRDVGLGPYVHFMVDNACKVLECCALSFDKDLNAHVDTVRQLLTTIPLSPIGELLCSLVLECTGTESTFAGRQQSTDLIRAALDNLIHLIERVMGSSSDLVLMDMSYQQAHSLARGGPAATGHNPRQALFDLGQSACMALASMTRAAMRAGQQQQQHTASLEDYLTNPVFLNGLQDGRLQDEPSAAMSDVILPLAHLEDSTTAHADIHTLTLYLISQHRVMSLPATHPVWRALGAVTAVLAYHLDLTEQLARALREQDFDDPALEEIFKACSAVQSHLVRIKQEQGCEYVQILEQLRDVTVFLVDRVQRPQNLSVLRSKRWSRAKVRTISVNDESVADVLLTKSPELPGRALSPDRLSDSVSSETDQAALDLGNDIEGNDWKDLVQAASHSWLRPGLRGKATPPSLCKNITELLVTYLRDPIELDVLEQTLDAQQWHAELRQASLANMTNTLDACTNNAYRFQLLRGLLGSPLDREVATNFGSIFANVESCSEQSRQDLMSTYLEFLASVERIVRSSLQQLQALPISPPASSPAESNHHSVTAVGDTTPSSAADALSPEAHAPLLRLINMAVAHLHQQLEGPVLNRLFEQDFLQRLKEIHAQLMNTSDQTPALRASSPSTGGSSGAISSSKPSMEASASDRDTGATSASTAATAVGDEHDSEAGQAMQNELNLAVDLPSIDPIATVSVSSGMATAQNLLNDRADRVWTSDGTKDSHKINLHIKPDACIRSLRLRARYGDSFSPRLIVVMGGPHQDSLEELNQVTAPQFGDEGVLLLDTQTKYYPLIQLQIKAAGINTRVSQIVAEGFDLGLLQHKIEGARSHLNAVSRLLNYLALRGAVFAHELSDRAIDNICFHCEEVVDAGSPSSQATFLSLFRPLVGTSRLQRRFASAKWTDLLLNLFHHGEPNVQILTIRFMQQVLPGVKNAEGVARLTTQLMAHAARLLVTPHGSDASGVGDEMIGLLRVLYGLPQWRKRLEMHIRDTLLLIRPIRLSLLRGQTINDDALHSVLATLAIMGEQSPRLRVGATGDHPTLGHVIVVAVESPTAATVYTRRSVDGQSFVYLSGNDLTKLILNPVQQFDFHSMLCQADGIQACALMLSESFSEWHRSVQSVTIHHRLLQSCLGLLKSADVLADVLRCGGDSGLDAAGPFSKVEVEGSELQAPPTGLWSSRTPSDAPATGVESLARGAVSPTADAEPIFSNGIPSSRGSEAGRFGTQARSPLQEQEQEQEAEQEQEQEAEQEQEQDAEQEHEQDLQSLSVQAGTAGVRAEARPDDCDEDGDTRLDQAKETLAEQVLRCAVGPSPLRVQYQDEEIFEACSRLLDSIRANIPMEEAPPTKFVTGTEAIERLDVSSNERHASRLLDGRPETAWSSSGQQGSHWIKLTFRENVVPQEVLVRHSADDTSYQPSRIVVYGGTHEDDLKELSVVEVPRTDMATPVLQNNTAPLRVLRLAIKRCHDGGFDTRVRGIEARGLLQATIPEDASLHDIFAEDVLRAESGSLRYIDIKSDLRSVASAASLTSLLTDIDDLDDSSACFFAGANKNGLVSPLLPESERATLGTQTLRFHHLPKLVEQDVIKVAMHKTGYFAITKAGQLLMAKGGDAPAPAPFAVAKPPIIVDVATSGHHTLAVSDNGQVWGHGSNTHGQLGLSHGRDISAFVLVAPELLTNVSMVACGKAHSGAVLESGELFMFGHGMYGRLGMGDETDCTVPTLVEGLVSRRITHIALGDRHTLAAAQDGSVFAWGYAEQGRCGVSTPRRKILRPIKVPHLPPSIVKVVCGSSTSAAISLSGALYVWGGGRRYRLGTGTEAVIWQPRTAHALNTHKVVDCALSSEHGVAVTDRGEVFVWGANDHGQLGADAGSEKTIIAPRVIKLPGEFPAVNRVHCFPYGTVLFRDLTRDRREYFHANEMPEPAELEFAREKDRLGENFSQEQPVDLLGVRVRSASSLTHAIAAVASADQQPTVLVRLTQAMKVGLARQLCLTWLGRGPGVIDQLSWSPSRVMLTLVDLMKLLSARAANTVESLQPIINAIMHLMERNVNLIRPLAALVSAEVAKDFPTSEDEVEHHDSDMVVLSTTASFGMIYAAVAILARKGNIPSCMELALALATLWLRHPRQATRHWSLQRLTFLIGTAGPDLTRELRNVVASGADPSLQSQEVSEAGDGTGDTGSDAERLRSPAARKASCFQSDSESEDESDPADTWRREEEGTSILSSQLFDSCRMSDSDELSVAELALLFARVGVNSSVWAIEHLRSGLVSNTDEAYSFKVVHEMLSRSGLKSDSHQKPLVESTDQGLSAALHEFGQSLWETLVSRMAFEEPFIKRNEQLLHSGFVRSLVALCACLELDTNQEQEVPEWFQKYKLMAGVMAGLTNRLPFPDDFVSQVMQTVGQREPRSSPLPAGQRVLDYFDNAAFSREMDRELLQWKASAPEDLKLPLSSRRPVTQLAELKFLRGTDESSHLSFSANDSSVCLKADSQERNTWVVADAVLTSGIYYWAVRCDFKGSARRYVGVGVGRNESQFPVGAARILSDGHLKSASLTIDIPQGFAAEDIVGVYLDIEASTVAFDVNGVKRGEISLPDLAPGDGVRPLVYLFSPDDKFSFLTNVPVPLCYEMHGSRFIYYTFTSDQPLALHSQPSLSSPKIGSLQPHMSAAQVADLPTPQQQLNTARAPSPSRLPQRVAVDAIPGPANYCLQVLELKSNSDGVWVHVANPGHRFSMSQVWCLLRDLQGNEQLRLLRPDELGVMPIINPTLDLASGQAGAEGEEVPEGARAARCVTKGSRHLIRAGPSLETLEVGFITPGTTVFYTDMVEGPDGTWLILHEESKRRFVDKHMIHLDAYSMRESKTGTQYFQLSDAHETIKAAPAVYQHLQGVDVDALRRRAYILEYASSLLLPLLPFFELNVQALGGREPSLALGGSAEGLRTLQSYIAFGHKERLLKSILQRTTETTARVTITLNRVQIQRTPEGLAGPDGSQSVFAQAARELRSVDQSVFLASSRCWKVKFRGEGLDDAGGGFSESISEMCEELRNHSVPLLIPTPNGRDEAGDNRDAFLLNPTSDSAYHLQLFEFLGTLIGIAIRTSSPITLQLAPCVWRLIAGLNLTIGDLKEVAANYVATLEFISAVSPADVFEQCDFPTTTPSSLEGVDYQVVPGARLTLARRDEYVRRSLELRLHEFDRQVAAIRRGLARVVPLPVISLFSADQLESLVSGGQHFDLELLRWMTKYKNCEASSHHVSWFWETMAAMTPEEHSLFLRFVWGRTRLPRTEADFAGNQFKLQASLGGVPSRLIDKFDEGTPEADAALPEALTCFFLLKLPRYSSQQVMSRKLRYAITHCKAIDSDAYARTNLADEAPAAMAAEAGPGIH